MDLKVLFDRDRDFFSSKTRSTITDPKYLVRRSKRAVVRAYAERYAKGCLVDLGCGTAEFKDLFDGHVNSYIRLDYPATQQSMGYGGAKIEIAGDVCAIPMGVSSVDSALLLDVLEHVFQVEDVLQDISRILKPGGTLLLTTPFIYPVHGKPYDYHRFSFYALERYLEKHGLRIIDRSIVGGYGTVLAVLLNQFLYRTFLGNVRLLYIVGLLLRPLWLAIVAAANCVGCALDLATRGRPTWVYMGNAVICEKSKAIKKE